MAEAYAAKGDFMLINADFDAVLTLIRAAKDHLVETRIKRDIIVKELEAEKVINAIL